ncbi:Cytosolic carboxypeptidase 6 [Borealophlyctis nickersoniae]|nr:Cytosolic carboxypeptidase 6 [Borealophlyctis nickersoniae]
MNGFLYGNQYDNDVHRQQLQTAFPVLLDRNGVVGFSLENTSYNRDAVKAGTGRRTLGEFLDKESKCYTLEVSFFCYQDRDTGRNVPYTVDKYKELGRNLVAALTDYYGLESQTDSTVK